MTSPYWCPPSRLCLFPTEACLILDILRFFQVSARVTGYCNWGMLDERFLPLGYGIPMVQGTPYKPFFDLRCVFPAFNILRIRFNFSWYHDHFSPKNSRKTPYSSPMRARYGVGCILFISFIFCQSLYLPNFYMNTLTTLHFTQQISKLRTQSRHYPKPIANQRRWSLSIWHYQCNS